MTHQGALAGIKVLDLTRMVSGPLATQTLADLGATVYKIERRGRGDDARSIGPFLADEVGARESPKGIRNAPSHAGMFR